MPPTRIHCCRYARFSQSFDLNSWNGMGGRVSFEATTRTLGKVLGKRSAPLLGPIQSF